MSLPQLYTTEKLPFLTEKEIRALPQKCLNELQETDVLVGSTKPQNISVIDHYDHGGEHWVSVFKRPSTGERFRILMWK